MTSELDEMTRTELQLWRSCWQRQKNYRTAIPRRHVSCWRRSACSTGARAPKRGLFGVDVRIGFTGTQRGIERHGAMTSPSPLSNDHKCCKSCDEQRDPTQMK